MDKKRYVICYRLNRKNAKRRECLRINAASVEEAVKLFEGYCMSKQLQLYWRNCQFELLTGDWKHLRYYPAEAAGDIQAKD